MAKIIDFRLESNRDKYQKEFEEVAKKILTELGMQAESAAKKLCPVDTGLLRNSITWAIAGETANNPTYKANKGNASGMYEGTSPSDKKYGEHSVHIGSNVEYAMVQETGSFNGKPHSFLRPAINNNLEYFKRIVETELKNAVVEE